MPYILGYTKSGDTYYASGNADNYPGFSALNCDVNDAMHMAYSCDGKEFFPLRNHTGILFPKADYSAGVIGGITKTLLQPWIFRMQEGGFGVCAVRRNQNAPDDSHKGCIMLFFSKDLVHFGEERFLTADLEEIRNPRCRWEPGKKMYYMEWENEQGMFSGYTACFDRISDKKCLSASDFASYSDMGIENALPGNVIEVSQEEGSKILAWLSDIHHTGVEIPALRIKKGERLTFAMLPKARCLYSDGSAHDKKVDWNREDFEKIDFSRPGAYTVHGEIMQERYEFPFVEYPVSDPYICRYGNQYYMILLDLQSESGVLACKSDSVEGLKSACQVKILSGPPSRTSAYGSWWAPELHIMEGIPYILTTVGTTGWNTTKSCIYQCEGDILNPGDWKGPYLMVKQDGTLLRPDGVSLDMTYFCVKGIHYVMWSDRKWADPDKELEPETQDSADICIASVNPKEPWKLTSAPVCIRRPVYGWERYETKVEEGPFLLQRGEELFVTIACSSTGLADLYCVGILHSDVNRDLLSPEGWDWLSYPVLTKESIPGEYGPGHNCFVKNMESGEDLFVYHAVPHDENDKALGRHMGIRRVHWGSSGYPYLEMTEERDLDPALKKAAITIEIAQITKE